MLSRLLLLLACCTILLAETTGAAAQAIAAIEAANRARASSAHEQSAWNQERERLQALIAAVEAETAALIDEATEGETAIGKLNQRLVAIDQASKLDELRRQVGSSAGTLRQQLRAAAAALPPGILSVPEGDDDIDGFDAIVAAIDRTERDSASVAVDIVPGHLDGKDVAVRLLRVAAAVGWWQAIDGTDCGIATMGPNGLTLQRTTDPQIAEQIHLAHAIIAGRAGAAVLRLPFTPLTEAK